MVTVTEPMAFNPFEPGFRADPYSTYRRLLAEDPVHHSPFGFVVLTRYADCAAVLRDPRSSSDPRRSGSFAEVPPAVPGFRPLLTMDGPDHARLRGLVSRAFGPKVVERLRPLVEQTTADLLAAVAGRDAIDVVDDLAYPLPVRIICEMLGVPAEDHETFKDWSRDAARGVEPEFILPPDALERRRTALVSLWGYFTDLIAERRRQPRDDLLSALIAAEDEGGKLDEDELISTCMLLLVAGHETTGSLIANGMLALLRNPSELARLREDPSLVPSAADEVLRFDPPGQFTIRWAREDMDVGGEVLPAGGQCVVVVAAANRDPAQFSDPDRFDVGRADNRHLAFGLGAHYCLGAALARVEGQVALAAMLRTFPHLELAVDEPVYKDNVVVRGLASLPVSVRAA
jgi:unspecific monooxygenase